LVEAELKVLTSENILPTRHCH